MVVVAENSLLLLRRLRDWTSDGFCFLLKPEAILSSKAGDGAYERGVNGWTK